MLNKELSIIIVNFKSEHLLEKCLASILEKIKDVSYEVVVVNNDSQEKLNFIQNQATVKIINLGKNIGFGAGNNLGVKEAQGEIILFLNPDAEIISNNIREILTQFSKLPDLGILSGSLVTIKGEVEKWSIGKETSIYNLILNNLGFSKSRKIWQSKKPIVAEWVSGTALFIRKDIFSQVRGFDENFFMYFEDMDLCRRVRDLGKKVLYYPQFIVKHKNGESYFKNKKKQKKDYYASQEYYFKKHYSLWQALLIRFFRKFF